MKFYHGGASKNDLKKIKSISDSFCHGIEQSPSRVRDRPNYSYFLDNGAFNSNFDEKEWVEMLEKVAGFESSPEWIVLPDVFDDAEATYERHQKYVSIAQSYGFDYYYVAQPSEKDLRKNLNHTIYRALELEASGIFLGGSWHKPRVLPKLLERARKKDLKVHIGMPGDLLWAAKSGADSMDTVSIVRNKSWNRIKRLENDLSCQKTL